MLAFLKTPLGIVLTIVAAGVVVLAFVVTRGGDSPYEMARVERGTVVQEVSVTGRVKAAESVSLAFEKAGRVSSISSRVGDAVSKGAVLVRLESSELLSSLTEADASVKVQRAKLAELLGGTRPEELEVQRVKVQNAEFVLEDAKEQVVNAIQEAYTKADDAVRNKVDPMFRDPKTPEPQLKFAVDNLSLEVQVENGRYQTELALSSWKSLLDALGAQEDIDDALWQAKQNLQTIKGFSGNLGLAINEAATSGTVTQTTLDGWKADVSTARTSVNTAAASVNTAEQSYQSAVSTLALETQNLVLKEAGATIEEIAAQEAAVEQAEAAAALIQAQLEKNALRAPFDGLVTRQEAKVGELVSAATIVTAMISQSSFEMEASVPEADIAKLNVGNTAQVTLDALGRDIVFRAQVAEIEPAETIVEGVATYKTTLVFLQEDERIKSGMTANIDIVTVSRENVLFVPQRAVAQNGGNSVIRIPDGEGTREVFVETGLRGSEGFIEIISGLEEGDTVITFVRGEL